MRVCECGGVWGWYKGCVGCGEGGKVRVWCSQQRSWCPGRHVLGCRRSCTGRRGSDCRTDVGQHCLHVLYGWQQLLLLQGPSCACSTGDRNRCLPCCMLRRAHSAAAAEGLLPFAALQAMPWAQLQLQGPHQHPPADLC